MKLLQVLLGTYGCLSAGRHSGVEFLYHGLHPGPESADTARRFCKVVCPVCIPIISGSSSYTRPAPEPLALPVNLLALGLPQVPLAQLLSSQCVTLPSLGLGAGLYVPDPVAGSSQAGLGHVH